MCGGDGGGKGALLTATVALASGERVESLARTAETAAVEKPLPPHSLGIFMAKKPSFMVVMVVVVVVMMMGHCRRSVRSLRRSGRRR